MVIAAGDESFTNYKAQNISRWGKILTRRLRAVFYLHPFIYILFNLSSCDRSGIQIGKTAPGGRVPRQLVSGSPTFPPPSPINTSPTILILLLVPRPFTAVRFVPTARSILRLQDLFLVLETDSTRRSNYSRYKSTLMYFLKNLFYI